MAASNKWYGLAFDSAFRKKIDIGSDTLKMMLVDNTYSFNQGTHDFKNDISGEVGASGTYPTGGVTLASVAIAYTGGTNTLALDAADVSITGFTGTPRGAVIYDATPGTDATRPLLLFIDFGADTPVVAGTLTFTWDAAGIASVTVA